MKTYKNTCGFTLIELLMALAITTILASIAIPCYTSYIKRAQTQRVHAQLTAAALKAEHYYMQHHSYNGLSLTTLNLNSNKKLSFHLTANQYQYQISATLIHDHSCTSRLNINSLGEEQRSNSNC